MKRLVPTALLAAAMLLAWPALSNAQAQPTPTPGPLVYQDRAMWYQAPDGWVSLGQRHIALADLGYDLTTLAGWNYPRKDHPRRIILEAEAFEGSVGDWDVQFEQQMRSQFDSPLFRDRERTSLKNGMPAMFVTMSSGEGFNVQKLYILIWSDGQRGMALVLVTALDDIDDGTARRYLSDVTAVPYPRDQ
jgi:hypothetical protein